MNKEIIGNFLKSLRKEKKLTQIQLSNEFDCIYSDATISKWEKGLSVPNIDDLKRLAEYFNVSVDEILNGTRTLTLKRSILFIIMIGCLVTTLTIYTI